MRKKQVNHIFTKKELARLRAAAVKKRKEGKCYALIAQELGVNTTTAFNWCMDGGCSKTSAKYRPRSKPATLSRPVAPWIAAAIASMKKEAA
jgi:hypothetical protein